MHFLNFLFEYIFIPMFKVNQEIRTKPQIRNKIIFSDEDLIKNFDGLEDKNTNFKVLIYLAFYTRLRSSDLLTLSAEKINLEKKTFSYFSPKSKKFKDLPFHSDLLDILTSRVQETNW